MAKLADSLGKHKSIVHLAVIALVVAALYASTLNYPFQFDDDLNIADNFITHDIRFMFMGRAEFEARGGKPVFYHHYRVRALPYISFYLSRVVAGGYDRLWLWRSVNIALHITMCWLVYAFVSGLFRTPRLSGVWDEGRVWAAAYISAMLYAVHPLMTETVIYISGRVGQIAALFYLGSVVAYLRWRIEGRGRIPWLSIFLGLCAMFSKETAVTLPLMVLLIEWMFFGGRGWAKWKAVVPHLCLLPVIPLTKMIVLMSATDFDEAMYEGTHLLSDTPRMHYLYTQFPVVARYLRLIFWPAGQNVEHGMSVIESFWNQRLLVSLALHLCVFAVAAALLWAGRKRPVLTVTGFGICGFYLALLPESSIFPIIVRIAEYRTYLPMAFFLPGVVAAGLSVYGTVKERSVIFGRAAVYFLLAVIVLLGSATHLRGIVWSTNIGLWNDSIAKNPANQMAYVHLATMYYKKSKYLEAAWVLEQGESKTQYSALTYLLLANCYQMAGDPERSLKVIEAVRNSGYAEYPQLIKDYANILAVLGRYAESEQQYKHLIELEPDDALPRARLGYVYLMSGRAKLAVEMFESALALKPALPVALKGIEEARRAAQQGGAGR